MIYIVSGLPSCGTSAMMGALVASGMHTTIDMNWKNRLNRKGFFEGGFPAHGMVTKRFLHQFGSIGARAIAMWRPRQDRVASRPDLLQFVDVDYAKEFNRVRSMADWTVIRFYDLLADPQKHAERLQHAGWPIDDMNAFCSWFWPNTRSKQNAFCGM